jgi:SAM-dependent methyltransferase
MTESTLPSRLRRTFYDLRTEGSGAGREAAAIGAGVFIGCSPFYGFHFLLCWAVGSLFALNRLQMYLAANISNPMFSPFLVFSEVQTGAWIRRGAFYRLTVDTIRTADVWAFGLDLLIGAAVIGAALGAVAAAGTYFTLRSPSGDPLFASLVRRASDRYIGTSITAWEFARGKLRGDPVYRQTLFGGVLPSGATLVDIGCGQGLMLALLAEGRRIPASGGWPDDCQAPPQFRRMVGVEHRRRVARLASHALAGEADIVEADARTFFSEPCSAVLLFDVLQMMPAAQQEELIAAMGAALEPGGVMLVREADASGGWRFGLVRVGNRLKALVCGNWQQRFHFRTRREWLDCFAGLGLDAQVCSSGESTPFANALFRLTARTRAEKDDLPQSHRATEHPRSFDAVGL